MSARWSHLSLLLFLPVCSLHQGNLFSLNEAIANARLENSSVAIKNS
jgi:hypothetical protein